MQGKQVKVAILGGGPAGIAAALQISHTCGYDVSLIDANPQIGRKLQVTGSGRCNLTNLNLDASRYASSENISIENILKSCPPAALRARLADFGIPTVATEDGWVYPLSYSAANVAEILRGQLLSAGVNLIEGTKVLSINPYSGHFEIKLDTQQDLLTSNQLVVATGSKAFPQLRADDSLLMKTTHLLGINCEPFRPALAPVLLKNPELRALSGIRLTLLKDKKPFFTSTGNVIFTDFGMNGPGCMNLSHLIEGNEKNPDLLEINFLPGSIANTIEAGYQSQKNDLVPYRNLYLMYLPAKVTDFFMKQWGLSDDTPCTSIDHKTFRSHLKTLSAYPVKSIGTKGFKDAQACFGGVKLSEINPDTMESKKIPGVYFAGEILDVVGPCGGYNLHWAFATGFIAGQAIAQI
jgi:hypothetical protein